MGYVEHRSGPPNDELASTRSGIQLLSADGKITLRQYIASDATAAFRLIQNNSQHLSQFGDTTGSKYKDTEDFKKSITDPLNPDRLRFGIWNNDSGKLIGSINLTPNDDNATVGEIGYYLSAISKGKGHMKRSVETLVNYAFENGGYDTLRGVVHKNNVGSVTVLHSTGFQFEKARKNGMVEFVLHK